jgi:hypothetical protein
VTISERVQRGAANFDEKLPGWLKKHRIDLRTLDLSRPCAGWLDLTFADAYAYGLIAMPVLIGSMPVDAANEIYRDLDVEWVRVITERRAAA